MKTVLIDALHALVAQQQFNGYFVAATYRAVGNDLPGDILQFLEDKYRQIEQGATGRRFVYRADGWYIFFTFYPTDKVVDEKYAMKNMPLNLRFTT